jgi:hypothetical protein
VRFVLALLASACLFAQCNDVEIPRDPQTAERIFVAAAFLAASGFLTRRGVWQLIPAWTGL